MEQAASPTDNVLRIAAFAVLLGGLLWAARSSGIAELLDPDTLREQGTRADPTVVALYFVFWLLNMGQVGLPTIAGSVLFGWLGGAFMAILGAFFTATVHLAVIRFLLRGPFESWFGRRTARVRAAVETRGLALMTLWRLLWMPGPLLTVAVGLSRIPFGQFVLATAGIIPGVFAYTLTVDSFYVYGPTGIPMERWGLIALLLTGGVACYLLALRRWPELKLLSGKVEGT